MKNIENEIDGKELKSKTEWFVTHCRRAGLKVTPQRIAVYQELLKTNEHPSAEILYQKVKQIFPSISLDTVNRTLVTLSEIGAAFVVEGSGDAKRYDAGSDKHQHFKCIKCRRIIDFHHKPFDDIKIPAYINDKFKVLRKTVYIEGICDLCDK
ncbi:MAG: transcriptional repressor [Sedimentisphaerales bacterium]|nr:transcriptional repressor [Sedimentisphaerales bacterium]